MKKESRIDWLVKYVREKGCVDVLNRAFVDDYEKHTGAKVDTAMYGANGCRQLGGDLASAAKLGYFVRHRVGISGCGTGFPKWVWSYRLYQP